MKHHIDPKIDCVFKALLGTEENINLLIHFLNAILDQELKQPIVAAEILNPYNDKEFVSDKLSIVDVKAKDSNGQLFQVEIQLKSYLSLPARIVYNWADIYSQQLGHGKNYYALQPTYSIWLLAEDVIKEDARYLHTFKLRDNDGRVLNEHGGIWLLELNKFNVEMIEFDQQRWLKFFKDGERLDDETLPDWMCTDVMRQAMTTLKVFSEKEREYFKYQARQEYLRQQRTIELEQEQRFQVALAALQEKDVALQEKDVALQEKDVALQEKDVALQNALQEKNSAVAELERLKALLAKQT